MKNHYPSSFFEDQDRCPNCGAKCDIILDLDENDYCNKCRD